MRACGCTQAHRPKRVVLTGGPGAGKTAVLETLRQAVCAHVDVLPESAGILFGGGFPRRKDPAIRRHAQRAIFYVQRELEAISCSAGLVVCDRGTVDALAYWPGPDDMFLGVGSSLDAELARYDAVIHLRTPPVDGGYNRDNPLRIETAAEAAAIDERIAQAWSRHPRRFEVPATTEFLLKATRAIELLRAEMPACCR
jgi:predicted ATPase